MPIIAGCDGASVRLARNEFYHCGKFEEDMSIMRDLQYKLC